MSQLVGKEEEEMEESEERKRNEQKKSKKFGKNKTEKGHDPVEITKSLPEPQTQDHEGLKSSI